MPAAPKALTVWSGLILLTLSSAALAGHARNSAIETPVPFRTTLDNVRIAYAAEVNAQAKYVAYANRAAADGYVRISRLFRAIARSEGMHAGVHARMIESLGGTPHARLDPVPVGATRENLEAAVAEETQDVERQYPEYARQAEQEGYRDVGRFFSLVKDISGNRSWLLAHAAVHLEEWKQNGDIYVCMGCGNIVTLPDLQFCPACKSPVSGYEKVP